MTVLLVDQGLGQATIALATSGRLPSGLNVDYPSVAMAACACRIQINLGKTLQPDKDAHEGDGCRSVVKKWHFQYLWCVISAQICFRFFTPRCPEILQFASTLESDA